MPICSPLLAGTTSSTETDAPEMDAESDGGTLRRLCCFALTFVVCSCAEESSGPARAEKKSRKRRSRPGSSPLSDTEAAESAAAPSEKKHRSQTQTDARAEAAIDFGLSFSDVQQLRHVEVDYHDDQMPAVRLWQADIVTANEEQQTFTVFIINTRKTVSGVPASHIRKRQRGSAAV